MLKKLAAAVVFMAPTMALAVQPGPYFSLGAAFGSVDLSAAQSPATTATDDEVQRVVIGAGYNLNDSLAVEALYLTNVENTIENGPLKATLDHDGLQFSVLAHIPLTSQFSVFGKASANLLQVEYAQPGLTVDDTGLHLGVGAGLAFQVSDQLGLRAAFERLMITDVGGSGGDFDVDQVAVSLNYSF